eukprot:TRINITY_DN9921_c0_g1_i4.p1 TRINITY_DN9921_c0_g1~~TRINITY_DN9921_c0_g1_i4.p1  ORF type:complete len:339 (+),score=29.33 TRINITY_DN9921_c0_g1_i4:297-1313(+)
MRMRPRAVQRHAPQHEARQPERSPAGQCRLRHRSHPGSVLCVPHAVVSAQHVSERLVCRLSGYVVAVPVVKKGLTAQRLGWIFVRDIFSRFGVPTEIRSDNDVLFEAAWWRTAMATMGVRHARCTAYRPQGNGAAERANGRVVETLRALLLSRKAPEDSWVTLLPLAVWSLNSTPLSGSTTSPNDVVFGRHMFHADDGSVAPLLTAMGPELWWSQRAEELRSFRDTVTHARAASVASKNRKSTPEAFAVGEQVWVAQPPTAVTGGKVAAKLGPKWCGPGTVKAFRAPQTYDVELDGVVQRMQVDRLKPFHAVGDVSVPERARRSRAARPATVVLTADV